MSIDTSSYYPEVPSPDGRDGAYSLNNRKGGLFGDQHDPAPEPQPESKPEKTPDNSPNTHSSKDKDDDKSLGEKITDGVSNLLSWVLVPLLMPVYGLMLAFGLSILDVAPMGMRIAFTLIVAGICVFVPMVLILLLKKIGMIEDVGLNGRQERLVPYIITIVCFGVTAWFMAAKGAPLWLSLFFAGGALATVICTVVNFWWKISAHAAGIAGVVALLIRIEKDGSAEPELFFWLILTLLLTGLLGSARVWLGRHTVWQVLAGYTVGFCSVFFLTMIR
ncbi:MAG: hypothetical protein K2H60_07175 [Muribaculaceae bacterium]|nr:hypothetical protein [Muribaculaceae bacterium]